MRLPRRLLMPIADCGICSGPGSLTTRRRQWRWHRAVPQQPDRIRPRPAQTATLTDARPQNRHRRKNRDHQTCARAMATGQPASSAPRSRSPSSPERSDQGPVTIPPVDPAANATDPLPTGRSKADSSRNAQFSSGWRRGITAEWQDSMGGPGLRWSANWLRRSAQYRATRPRVGYASFGGDACLWLRPASTTEHGPALRAAPFGSRPLPVGSATGRCELWPTAAGSRSPG